MLQIIADASSVKIDGTKLETNTPSVTRYRGDAWDRIASDILCGVADANAGACVVVSAAPYMVSYEHDILTAAPDEWTEWPSADESISWWRKFEGGWLLLPRSRDAVENSMAWTMPYLNQTIGSVVADSRSFVYDRYGDKAETVQNILARSDASLREIDNALRKAALFEFTWTYGHWTLLPIMHSLDHVIRLADPVVSRINMTLL